MIQLLHVLIFCAAFNYHFLYVVAKSKDWKYENDGDFSKYKTCSGIRQSPIDLRDGRYKKNITPINFKNYFRILKNPILTNTGHTAELTAKDFKGEISGGLLRSNYTFFKLDFHWGSNNKQGSEHSIKGERFPMEMQLFHFNNKYNLSHAFDHSDGLAIISVLFEISTKDNPELKSIVNCLDKIRYKDQSETIDGDIRLEELLPKNKGFFTYYGSLTTPMCNEVVIWTIYSEMIPISNSQIKAFRHLYFGYNRSERMVNNFRSIQALKDRKLYEFKPN